MTDPLAGDGVVLRAWTQTDVDAVRSVVDDVVTRRFGLPGTPWPREQVERWRDAWDTDDDENLLVQARGRVVGRVALRRHDAGHRARLTWVTFGPYRGRGYAGAAVSALVARAFAQGVQRVEALVEDDNAASLALAARVGLRREGVLRRGQVIGGRARDLVLLARLAGDVDPEVDPLPTLAASFPRACSAAAVVIRDPTGRVLLLETSYKADWEVPGGLVEPGEDVASAARREVREELGMELEPGPLLALDTWPTDGRTPDMTLALLDGGVHPGDLVESLTFPDGEIVAARWCDRAAVRARGGHRLPGRLLAVLDALDDGRLPGPALLLRSGEPRTPGVLRP